MEAPLPELEASAFENVVFTGVNIAELKLGNLCIKDLDATKLTISKIGLEINNASFRRMDNDSSSKSTEEIIRTSKTEIDPEETPLTRRSAGKAVTGLLDGTAKEFTPAYDPEKQAYVEDEPVATEDIFKDVTAKELTPAYDPEKQAYVEDEPESDQIEEVSAYLASLMNKTEDFAGYIPPHIRARSRKSQDSS